MTGAYLRVNRSGKWESIEVEHLTDAERVELFESRQPEELVRWMHVLCAALATVDRVLSESDGVLK